MSNPFVSGMVIPDFCQDIDDFHAKFGLRQGTAKAKLDPHEWELRHKRLKEELDEYLEAVAAGNDVATLDALVDLVYIALGTAYRRGWDFGEAWTRVHEANMEKERGEEHNSKYGSSFDIIKPEDWQAPVLDDLV
jgi:predicted HAD superfamily Cof-like phosphohydrolase